MWQNNQQNDIGMFTMPVFAQNLIVLIDEIWRFIVHISDTIIKKSEWKNKKQVLRQDFYASECLETYFVIISNFRIQYVILTILEHIYGNITVNIIYRYYQVLSSWFMQVDTKYSTCIIWYVDIWWILNDQKI